MKRLLAIFCTLAIITATAMVPTVFAAAPTNAVIQELPEQSALHPDPQNPYKDPTEGFYRCPVSVGENTRDAIVYEPTTSYLKMQTVFIAAPAGTATDTVEDVAQWLIDTGWVETAETHQFRIACMFTTSEWASDPADEFEYMEAVRGIIRKRVFWNAGNASFYLVGYEGGAGVTAYAAMMDPTHYAGLVTFGGKGISQDYMEFCETNCVDHEGFLVENKMRSEMDARTWMFIPTSEKNDAVIQKNIAYWKNANDVSADTAAMSSAYADEIYQEANYQSLELNEHSVGALWVTYVDSSSEYYTSGMTEQVYTQFLQKAWRFEAFPDSSLRAYEDPVDSGKLVRYTMTSDGWLREYYVYCPDSVKDSGQNVPLVICTHGSGGTGKEMFSRTEWAKVADNSGFIVVFPTSLYTLDSTGAPTTWNTNASTENRVDDVKFIRSMFEQLKKDYKIDTSRVYSSGHSNGTSMAVFLGVACPDIITAVATSAPVFGETSYDGMMPAAKTEYNTAVMVALGTNDEYAVEEEGVANIDGLRSRSVRAYWENHWGFNAEAYNYYRNGAYENYVYTNEEGQTVYRYVKVNENLHAPLPELSYMFYEFMSQYSRGSDGALYCMGEVVNKKVAASNEETSAPVQKPTAMDGTYTVVAGDCLWNIAVKFYGSGFEYDRIIAANPSITNASAIYAGQVLVIPAK